MLTMLVAAVIGGYGAARLAGFLPARASHLFVLLLSATVTAGAFVRQGG
jgi:hypothetical protein